MYIADASTLCNLTICYICEVLHSCRFSSSFICFLSFFFMLNTCSITFPGGNASIAVSLSERWALRDSIVSLLMLSGPKTMPCEIPKVMFAEGNDDSHVATEAVWLGSDMSWIEDTQQCLRQLVKIAWSTDLMLKEWLETNVFLLLLFKGSNLASLNIVYLHWLAFLLASLCMIFNWSCGFKGKFHPKILSH